MKGKKWKPAEDEILKATYKAGTVHAWKESQARLKEAGFIRPKRGIHRRARVLNLTQPTPKARSQGAPPSFPIGTIRIHKYSDSKHKYKLIKTADGWQNYAHYVLNQNGVQIPPKYCVWFIDRDPLNVTLENIEIIPKIEKNRRNTKAYHARQRKYRNRSILDNIADGLTPKETKVGACKYIIWK